MISSLSHFFLELLQLKERFPLTLVYTKLQWCGYGVELASRLVPSNVLEQNTGSDLPSVVQYHAQQPNEFFFHLFSLTVCNCNLNINVISL